MRKERLSKEETPQKLTKREFLYKFVGVVAAATGGQALGYSIGDYVFNVKSLEEKEEMRRRSRLTQNPKVMLRTELEIAEDEARESTDKSLATLGAIEITWGSSIALGSGEVSVEKRENNP